MENLNAFIGKTDKPTSEELKAVLGPTSALWNQLVDVLKAEVPNLELEWHSLKPKWGWALILKVKKRRIVYLNPFAGCFQASLVLGDKAMTAARAADLSKRTLKVLDDAPHYPEGNGIQFTVKNAKDLPAIRKLAQIKLAN